MPNVRIRDRQTIAAIRACKAAVENAMPDEVILEAATEEEVARLHALEDEVNMVSCMDSNTPATALFATKEFMHGGMYVRTIFIPAGSFLIGGHIKPETVVILQGTGTVVINGKETLFDGYKVFKGAANRKMSGQAVCDSFVTMIARTDKTSTAEAEEEVVVEHLRLLSNADRTIDSE